MKERANVMNGGQLKKKLWISSGGIICQLIAVISGSPYGLLSLPAICILGWGYYGNLKAKGHDPLHSGWFYVLTIISFLGPVIGPIAALQKLSLMGRPGEQVASPKTNLQSLISVAAALVIVAFLIMLSWPSISYHQKSEKVYQHLELAQQQAEKARLLKDAGKDYSLALATAEAELAAAKDLAASFQYTFRDNMIATCSGDINFLRGRFKDAERDYAKALELGYSRDVIKERLALLKKSKKKRPPLPEGNRP